MGIRTTAAFLDYFDSTRRTGRVLASIAGLVLLTSMASGPAEARCYVRIRGASLEGAIVTAGGRSHRATQLLEGGSAAGEGLWLRSDCSLSPSDIRFTPEVEASIEIVSPPRQLSRSWQVVALRLSPLAVRTLHDLSALRLSESRRGTNAGSFTLRESAARKKGVPFSTLPLPIRLLDESSSSGKGTLRNRVASFAGHGGSATLTGRRLETASPAEKSFAGVWIGVTDEALLADREFGVELKRLASVLIRGRGKAKITVRLSDVAADRAGEGLVIGEFETPDGEWEKVVPLDKSRVDRSRLRSLALDLSANDHAVIELDKISLLDSTERRPRAAVSPHRGLWVWNTKELLLTPDSLFAAVEKWKISDVYLQLPHDDLDLTRWRSRSPAVARLVAALHERGLKVHALDGASWLALEHARGDLLGVARSVEEYNRSAPANGRFDALHLDVEPYLLRMFGGARRGELLEGFAESLRELRGITSLPLWLDIPFWFDSSEAPSNAPQQLSTTRFLADAMSIVDGIVVMSYRTRADGSNGIAALAATEARLALARGIPLVIALESARLRPESGWDLQLDGNARPVAGKPLALIPLRENGYLLFSPAPSAADLAWIGRQKDWRPVVATYDKGYDPKGLTFFGRRSEEMQDVAAEALALLEAGGSPAAGVAFHELRTLP